MKKLKDKWTDFMIFMGYAFVTLIVYTLMFGTVKIG